MLFLVRLFLFVAVVAVADLRVYIFIFSIIIIITITVAIATQSQIILYSLLKLKHMQGDCSTVFVRMGVTTQGDSVSNEHGICKYVRLSP